MKQKTYIAGLYYRLSQEDERQGESVSIDNQRAILRKHAEEHGFEIHGEYIDDGVSGTTFQRPEVQRLLDDAKTGVIINLTGNGQNAQRSERFTENLLYSTITPCPKFFVKFLTNSFYKNS